MKCSNCQIELAPDASFCGACGTRVAAARPAAPPPQPEIDLAAMRTFDDVQTRQPSRTEQKRLQPGEVFADRYTITQLIGEGGMGVVYRAQDKITEKEVALKLIRAERLAGQDAVKRLIREGVTSRDIRHPNVVAVYDVGEAGGQPYISMEFLAGRSLRSWTRERLQGPDCSLQAAAHIVFQILDGLEASHNAGVVHRDLKPENVILLSEPTDQGVRLKLLDFGIARAPQTGDTGATSLGTRGYMAPEQLTAPDAAQASADLYSLSVMFYELLVGVVPQGYWQPPSGGRSDVTVAIDDLIQKGLSSSPRARIQSAAEYRDQLKAALKQKIESQPVGGTGTWMDRPEVQDVVKRASSMLSGERSVWNGQVKRTLGRDPEPGGGEAPAQRSLWQWFVHNVTRRYADGKGRAHRKEYWGFNVGSFSVIVAALVIDAAMGGEMYYDAYGYGYAEAAPPTFATIAWLALLAPSIGVASRRMHDLGYTGWLAALLAIPGLGFVVAVLMGLPRGAPGANAFGPDPLADGGRAP